LEELGKRERKNKYLCLKFNTMKKIEQSELDQITKANSDFAQIKETIANIEIQKHQSLHKLSALQVEFKTLEDELIKKYGDNVTINIKTGEITENVEDK
jgi:hypothetical protein